MLGHYTTGPRYQAMLLLAQSMMSLIEERIKSGHTQTSLGYQDSNLD